MWLQDYAVFHGLDPELLRDSKTVAFDNASSNCGVRRETLRPRRRRQTWRLRVARLQATLPLPPDEAREERLMAAINALSTYNLNNSISIAATIAIYATCMRRVCPYGALL